MTKITEYPVSLKELEKERLKLENKVKRLNARLKKGMHRMPWRGWYDLVDRLEAENAQLRSELKALKTERKAA